VGINQPLTIFAETGWYMVEGGRARCVVLNTK